MKWFHAIGVSGHATVNVAKMFQDMGWFVTGSDTQFFPPASDVQRENNINTVEGYNFRHLTKVFWEEKLNRKLDIADSPELVLFISYLTDKNKEYLYAKKKGLNVMPYARILGEYLVKDESIVVTGTAGKTTLASLITYIFKELQLDPSYMVGAPAIDFKNQIENTESTWSVMEGDEYHNPDPDIEGRAKFLEYKAKYLIITNIGWEHQDIFPTQESYVEQFSRAVSEVPQDGFIVAKKNDANIEIALKEAKCEVLRYAYEDAPKRGHWSVVKGDRNIIYDQNAHEVFNFDKSLLGDYNLENILACVILMMRLRELNKLQFEDDRLIELIANFKGSKKRLEILFKDETNIVVDDFGVAPERAKNSLKTLQENFPDFKITAIFEPNAGSRPKDEVAFKAMYRDTFVNVDELIIPDLSTANPALATSAEFETWLKDLNVNVSHIDNASLDTYLEAKFRKEDKNLFVFFSSYRLTANAKRLAEI